MKKNIFFLTSTLIASIFGFYFLVSSLMTPRHAYLIQSSAAILYYNSPAAIKIGNLIKIGFVDQLGQINLATFNTLTHKTTHQVLHDFKLPDDHAAPALWPTQNGTLIATAFHSTELFLYEISNDTIKLVCKWAGEFSYPRFTEVDNEIWLYARTAENRTGNLAVLVSPQSCPSPLTIHKTQPSTWIYAAAPDKENLVWSIWDGEYHQKGFLNGQEFKLAPSHLDETLMWSVAGRYVSATRFSGSFSCCGKGEHIMELYYDDKLTFQSPTMQSPYYPIGIVINRDAREAIFPQSDGQLLRKNLQTLEELPTCPSKSKFNSRAQYVLNGDGAYIWQAFDEIEEREYSNARVMLCYYESDEKR